MIFFFSKACNLKTQTKIEFKPNDETMKIININKTLGTKICNKNIENHHCKLDFEQKTYVRNEENDQ